MTQTAVHDLQPGDAVCLFPGMPATACFIASSEHPLWPTLQLVIWRMADGGWSHDALSPHQVVGDVTPAEIGLRTGRLHAALIGADGDWTQVR